MLLFLICTFLLLSLLSSLVFSNTQSINGVTVDLEMQRVLLDKHNSLRNSLALNGISSSGQPKATFMNQLHWDPIIAATAQEPMEITHLGSGIWS